MKISVPQWAVASVLRALHDSELEHFVLQRTGNGWIIETLRPPGVEVADLVALGAVEL